VTDADLPAQTIAFSISGSGADNGAFEIVNGNELQFIAAPDFENPVDADGDNVYEVSVLADDGNGGLTPQTITVTVDPVNDNAPVLTSPTTADVAENTTVVHTLTATDADLPTQTIGFSISGSGADNGAFEIINGNQLQFIAAPDFETPADADGDNVYQVSVLADDGNGGLTPQTILVTVTDVNDAPVFTSPATANVAETTQPVQTLSVTDADLPAQTITFSISGSGADNGAFEIINGNQLQFVAAPDFENPADADGDNVYEVSVLADDGNGGVTPQTILVTVTDVAEPQIFVVDILADEDDGDVTAGDLSLREAIGLANANLGADTITFAASLSGGAINLTDGELAISESLTIDAGALAQNVTIDAQQNSRVLDFTATTGDLTLTALTLTGGRTTGIGGSGRGGGVQFVSSGQLTLTGSTVNGNSTNTGSAGFGGGIFAAGDVTLTGSTVSGNSTTGFGSPGGGIFAVGNVTLTSSTLSGNATVGDNGLGGGLFAFGNVTLTGSTVSGNSITGANASGGGIGAAGSVTLTNSIVTGNVAVNTGNDQIYSGGGTTRQGGTIEGGTLRDGATTVQTGLTAADIFARRRDRRLHRRPGRQRRADTNDRVAGRRCRSRHGRLVRRNPARIRSAWRAVRADRRRRPGYRHRSSRRQRLPTSPKTQRSFTH